MATAIADIQPVGPKVDQRPGAADQHVAGRTAARSQCGADLHREQGRQGRGSFLQHAADRQARSGTRGLPDRDEAARGGDGAAGADIQRPGGGGPLAGQRQTRPDPDITHRRKAGSRRQRPGPRIVENQRLDQSAAADRAADPVIEIGNIQRTRRDAAEIPVCAGAEICVGRAGPADEIGRRNQRIARRRIDIGKSERQQGLGGKRHAGQIVGPHRAAGGENIHFQRRAAHDRGRGDHDAIAEFNPVAGAKSGNRGGNRSAGGGPGGGAQDQRFRRPRTERDRLRLIQRSVDPQRPAGRDDRGAGPAAARPPGPACRSRSPNRC